MESHLEGVVSDAALVGIMPGGVAHGAYRIASAPGGLVHVPPSGFWRSHQKARYLDARVWLDYSATAVDPTASLSTAIQRYLGGYGPASVTDIGKWLGQPRIGKVRAAIAGLGDQIVHLQADDGRELVDLAGCPVPSGDLPVPARFLARWDSVLISYDVRRRILPDAFRDAVVRKNGDFLPTFLVDGFVAGLWAIESTRGVAVLRLKPFATVPSKDRRALEEEGQHLLAFVEPDAQDREVAWA